MLFTVATPIYIPTNSVQEILKWPQGPVSSETCLPIPPQLISLHLNSPQLTSPHLTCMRPWRLWPHVQGRHLAPRLISVFPSLDSHSLQRCLPFPLTFFAFHIIIIHSSPSGYLSQCLCRLVFVAVLYFKLHTRTKSVLVQENKDSLREPHLPLSESHTQHLGLCGCSIILVDSEWKC